MNIVTFSGASWMYCQCVSPYRSKGACSEIWGICDGGSQHALHLTAEWPQQFPCLPRLRPSRHTLDATLDFEWWYSLICITIASDAPWVSNSSIMRWLGSDQSLYSSLGPHGIKPMQCKIQDVWITKNPHWTYVHNYELQLKTKCHKLYKLDKETFKRLQKLNRHLIFNHNFMVKRENCAVIWPNWTQNGFEIQ